MDAKMAFGLLPSGPNPLEMRQCFFIALYPVSSRTSVPREAASVHNAAFLLWGYFAITLRRCKQTATSGAKQIGARPTPHWICAMGKILLQFSSLLRVRSLGQNELMPILLLHRANLSDKQGTA